MSKTEKVHGKQNRKYGKICQVSEERPTKSSDDRYMFSVNSVKFVMENFNVNVENVNLKMIIDSGAFLFSWETVVEFSERKSCEVRMVNFNERIIRVWFL